MDSKLSTICCNTNEVSHLLRNLNPIKSPGPDHLSRTGGSAGWASGCHAGGREFDSDRTNTQGLKVPVTLFFSIFDEKLSHPLIQIKKKQLKFLRLSMGFDRKTIKI